MHSTHKNFNKLQPSKLMCIIGCITIKNNLLDVAKKFVNNLFDVFLKKKKFKMSYTEDFELPTHEELTVQEVNLSGNVLKAGANHLGKACEYQNNVRLII